MAGGDGDLMCQRRAVVLAVVIRAAMTRRMAVLAWSWSVVWGRLKPLCDNIQGKAQCARAAGGRRYTRG